MPLVGSFIHVSFQASNTYFLSGDGGPGRILGSQSCTLKVHTLVVGGGGVRHRKQGRMVYMTRAVRKRHWGMRLEEGQGYLRVLIDAPLRRDI